MLFRLTMIQGPTARQSILVVFRFFVRIQLMRDHASKLFKVCPGVPGQEVHLPDFWRSLGYRICQPGFHLNCARNWPCMILKFELMAEFTVISSTLQAMAYFSAVQTAIVLLVGTFLRWFLFRSVKRLITCPLPLFLLYSCLSLHKGLDSRLKD